MAGHNEGEEGNNPQKFVPSIKIAFIIICSVRYNLVGRQHEYQKIPIYRESVRQHDACSQQISCRAPSFRAWAACPTCDSTERTRKSPSAQLLPYSQARAHELQIRVRVPRLFPATARSLDSVPLTHTTHHSTHAPPDHKTSKTRSPATPRGGRCRRRRNRGPRGARGAPAAFGRGAAARVGGGARAG